MECPHCQKPLAESATVCGACGTDVLVDVPDVTTLAGTRGPDTTGGPPRGEVLAERWEIEDRISADVLMSRYRAQDQETEAHVVLTLIAPELVPSVRERATVRERLANAVGIGNKYLPGLLDADCEAQFVFAVEPHMAGTSLRSVLDARRARGETMQVAEVLPVVAQLAAALSGIAPPHHHGDVRAERVIIGPEGLRLVGPFVLPALSAASVARAIATDDAWRRVLAPEVLHGIGGDAADRYGVAAIAFEALTGRLPDAASTQLRSAWLGGALEPIDEVLRALLVPEPSARPRSLEALIEALAECAHLSVPDLDPSAFRRVRRPPTARPDTSPAEAVDADSTSRMPALNAEGELYAEPETSASSSASEPPHVAYALAPDTLPSAYRVDESATLAENALQTRRVVPLLTAPAAVAAIAVARPIAGAAAGGTQEIALEDVFDAAPVTKPRKDESLDPRLVRAALGVALDDEEEPKEETPAKKPRKDDSLDPRLVRAALGVALDEPEELDELDEIEEPATTLRPAAPARPKKSSVDTQELTSGDLAEMTAAASRRSARVTSNTAAPSVRRKRDAEPAEVVRIPRYDVSKPGQAPRAPAPARASTPAPPAPVRALAPQRAPIAREEDLAASHPRASSGRAVIWISLVLAIAIVSAGAAVAWWRNSAAQEANERERHLQERFQQLRQVDPTQPAPP